MTSTARPTASTAGLRDRAARHHRTLGLAGAVAAVGMTAVWTVVVPDKADATTGLQSLVIRWGHPACWALLAGVGLSVALDAPRRVRDPLAWSALGSYGAFLLALAL